MVDRVNGRCLDTVRPDQPRRLGLELRQLQDRNPWGGINSTYGAVLAQYSAATGSPVYKRVAEQALTFALYAVEDNGCPHDSVLNAEPGGWQEDAHTDKVHNIVDALETSPEWGRAVKK